MRDGLWRRPVRLEKLTGHRVPTVPLGSSAKIVVGEGEYGEGPGVVESFDEPAALMAAARFLWIGELARGVYAGDWMK